MNASIESVEAEPESVLRLAMVQGEPVTEMPRDLYIPPEAMEVFLDAFEGPLDLLLYLIRKQNLNILDIPIAEITRQYMKYIDLMQELSLDLAGEYMVMAATLAEIKSRMLLPRATQPGDGLEDDPRAELVRRLQEYERFKQAAVALDEMPRLERDYFQAVAEVTDRRVKQVLPEVALQELLLAFRDVAMRSEMFAHHHVQREPLSVRERMTEILVAVGEHEFIEFQFLFRPAEGRMGVTVTFVALLELLRESLVDVVQREAYAPLHVRRGSAPTTVPAVSEAPASEAAVGEVVVDEAVDDEFEDDQVMNDSDGV